MNSNDSIARGEITVQLVSEAALPKHFGRYVIAVEAMVQLFTSKLVPEYRSGRWQYYELSNGGFYMAPDIQPSRVYVESNGFEGQMSAEAIGIIVCLFSFSLGVFRFLDDPEEIFARHHDWLRDFARLHSESALIFAALA
jgi:hypothetical protein